MTISITIYSQIIETFLTFAPPAPPLLLIHLGNELPFTPETHPVPNHYEVCYICSKEPLWVSGFRLCLVLFNIARPNQSLFIFFKGSQLGLIMNGVQSLTNLDINPALPLTVNLNTLLNSLYSLRLLFESQFPHL